MTTGRATDDTSPGTRPAVASGRRALAQPTAKVCAPGHCDDPRHAALEASFTNAPRIALGPGSPAVGNRAVGHRCPGRRPLLCPETSLLHDVRREYDARRAARRRPLQRRPPQGSVASTSSRSWLVEDDVGRVVHLARASAVFMPRPCEPAVRRSSSRSCRACGEIDRTLFGRSAPLPCRRRSRRCSRAP